MRKARKDNHLPRPHLRTRQGLALWAKRLLDRYPRLKQVLKNTRSSHALSVNGLIGVIDAAWSDEFGLGIRGWVMSKASHESEIAIMIDGVPAERLVWHARPDVLAAYPNSVCSHLPGFVAYLPTHRVRDLCVQSCDGSGRKTFHFRSTPFEPQVHVGGLFKEFVALVNRPGNSILEIGSRIVSPGSMSNRSLFSEASEYVGLDYYPDGNTDVVGDAHELSSLVTNNHFDAVFSKSVFEHLAMPWVVAAEINKVLKIGGLAYHATHQTWPLHEAPWDFWRFSDEGLKVLFPEGMGFEVVQCGVFSPVRIHPEKVEAGQESIPNEIAYGGSAILVRKVAELDPTKFVWRLNTAEATSRTHYPAPHA